MGWVKTLEVAPSQIDAARWPWHWTYALFLEKRWAQIQEIGALYGDDKGSSYEKEIPKEFWHDQKRVDEWIEGRKRARNNVDGVDDLRPKDGYTHYLDKK